MFTNVSQTSAGVAALGAHAVLFGTTQAAECVLEESASSYSDSSMAPGVGARNTSIGSSRFNGVWFFKVPPPPPPGGGAGRPGAPGAPAGGGSGSGGGPKKNMTVDDVLVTLHQLEMKRDRVALLPEELEFLQEEGLIERISDADYKNHKDSVLRVDFLNRDLEAAREEQGTLSRSRGKLLQIHNGRWHATFTGRKKLAEEDAELKRSANRLKEISESIEQIEEELRNLKITKEYLATFVLTSYGHMRLSRKGGQLLESIKNRNRE